MSDFFQPHKQKVGPVIIREDDVPESATKKKYDKRIKTNSFSAQNIMDRLHKLDKKPPKANIYIVVLRRGWLF